MATMKTAQPGRDLIQSYEKLRLIGYLCQAGKPTAGWGHTGADVQVGEAYTREQAEAWFTSDLAIAERVVNAVGVPLTQNQFDALVSLVFNIGVANFATSTLRKCLRSANYAGAADQLPCWNKVRVNGVLQISNGLVARRKTERRLFLR
jgi:lysozyme